MNDENEVSGIFDAINEESHAHDPVEPVNPEPVAEGGEAPVEQTETQETATPSEGGETTVTPAEGQAEVTQPTEETSQETQAEIDWKASLPPAPLPYNGPAPEFNEEGQIVNMTPEQYQTYMEETIAQRFANDNYTQRVENAALDAAEQVLPEIKTNPAVRQMVESIRIASILSGGDPVDSYEAAKQVRDALGIAPERLAQAKAEGAQNAKVSIETQSNAAVETGSSQSPDLKAEQIDALHQRIRRGDDEAFADLIGIWEENGSLQ